MPTKLKETSDSKEKVKECFVIMPISDPEGYNKGHFKQVYQDIICPSCEKAGYKAIRADDVKSTSFIHVDILKQLLDAPLAICDLSNHNPNVLFELGIRQSFDKPVALIQEKGTSQLFDIAPLRIEDYCKKLGYRDVLDMQNRLTVMLEETAKESKSSNNTNSIIKLLSLHNAAKIPEFKGEKEEFTLEILQAEIREMKKMFETVMYNNKYNFNNFENKTIKYDFLHKYRKIINNNIPSSLQKRELRDLLHKVENELMNCNEREEQELLQTLRTKIRESLEECSTKFFLTK